MSLSEAFEATVTHAEAICEVLRHGASVQDFYQEFGRNPTYLGSDVLSWLGW